MPALIYGTRHQDEAVIVRAIFVLAGRGDNAGQIAAKLNSKDLKSPGGGVWTDRSVRRLLRDQRLVHLANGHAP